MFKGRKHSCHLGLSSSLLVLSALSQQAVAEQTSDDEQAFEQITVTANRTASLASKTPVALSAATGENLRDAGVTNPSTLADVVPNLSIDRNNGLQITIRGVTSTDNTEKGDPSAAFLLDGVYIARPQVQEVSFFDIARVEVLRGPQGTLYGRNTTAGLVNVIARRPELDYTEGSFELGLGNYGSQQATGVFNLPVGDNFAIRTAVNIERRDSFLENQSGTAIDVDPYKDNQSFRLSALYAPTDDFEILVRADYASLEGSLVDQVPVSNLYQLPDNPPADGELGTAPIYRNGVSNDDMLALQFARPFEDRADNDTWGVHAELSWSINSDYTLYYLGSYREFTRDEQNTSFIGVFPQFNLPINVRSTFTGDYAQNSQELRLAYDGENLQAQTGLYYFREHSAIELLLFGLLNPVPGNPGYIFGFPQDPTVSKSIGAFAQGTYSLSDDWRVTAGIRYTEDEKSRRGATIFHSNVDDPINFTAGDILNDAERTFDETTWKLGLEHDLDSYSLFYASIATGYKAGGFNDGCLAGQANCNSPLPEEALFYQPETLTSYEVGVKTRFLDNRLTLNSAYFHYDYKDLQLSENTNLCGGPCQITTNAAEASIDGVELETRYQLTSSSRIDLDLTWLDARYDDYNIAPGVNFEGQSLDRSPEWVVRLGYQYDHELSNGGMLSLALSSRWSDEYFIQSTPLRAQFEQPSFTKSDITLTYHSPEDDWYAQLFAKNLENELTVSHAEISVNYPLLTDGTVNFADPRLFGVRVGYEF
ncbi:TonB-dependent receptor [Thalassotalea montiporae]